MENYNGNFNQMQAAKIMSIYGGEIVKSESTKGFEMTQDILKSESAAFEDMIQKGVISDNFVYGYGGNKPMEFTKTGKELKELIPAALTYLTTQKSALESQMAVIKQQAGIEPDTSWFSSIANLNFPRYTWELCDASYDSTMGKYLDPTDQNTLCTQYNSLSSTCRDIAEDIATLTVIANNVVDNKSYTLTIPQLVALGIQQQPIAKSEVSDILKSDAFAVLESFAKSEDSSNDSDDMTDEEIEKAGIEPTMKEWKEGTLKDSHGNKVTDRKQAIAIGMSEQREKNKK